MLHVMFMRKLVPHFVPSWHGYYSHITEASIKIVCDDEHVNK